MDRTERFYKIDHMLQSRGRVKVADFLDELGVSLATFKRDPDHMRDEATQREVSPQRLVHYRNNWYLDGWCHLRNDLRSFSLDAIREVGAVAGKVKDVPDEELDATLAASYGIFSGRKVQWATL